MKKRYIEDLSSPQSDDDSRLRQLLRAHYDQENREKWTNDLKNMGVHRDLSVQSHKWTLWRLAAAILLIVAAVGIWKWQASTTPQALALNLIKKEAPINLPANFRGDNSNNPSPQYAKALQAYEQNNFSEAIRILNTLNPAYLSPPERLLMGVSYLYSADYPNAVRWLQNTNIQDPNMANQADWFLALAYIQINDYAQAMPLLQKQADNPNALYYDNARQLLNLLEK